MAKQIENYRHLYAGNPPEVDPYVNEGLPGNWVDHPCYYVSVIDDTGTKFNVIAGPFRNHQAALDMVQPARKVAEEVDRKAVWYAFGTVKMQNGYRNGILNERLGLEA